MQFFTTWLQIIRRWVKCALVLSLFSMFVLFPNGHAAAENFYISSYFELTLQDPNAKTIGPASRLKFVLKEIYDRDCACFQALLINDKAVEMMNNIGTSGIVATDGSTFVVHDSQSRACPHSYFIISFRHPAWPSPVRTKHFGDCLEAKSISFSKGTVSILFEQDKGKNQVVTFKDGKLSTTTKNR